MNLYHDWCCNSLQHSFNIYLWLITSMFFLLVKREYVVYPTETVRPQSPEELREMAKEIGRKRERDQAMRS